MQYPSKRAYLIVPINSTVLVTSFQAENCVRFWIACVIGSIIAGLSLLKFEA